MGSATDVDQHYNELFASNRKRSKELNDILSLPYTRKSSDDLGLDFLLNALPEDRPFEEVDSIAGNEDILTLGLGSICIRETNCNGEKPADKCSLPTNLHGFSPALTLSDLYFDTASSDQTGDIKNELDLLQSCQSPKDSNIDDLFLLNITSDCKELNSDCYLDFLQTDRLVKDIKSSNNKEVNPADIDNAEFGEFNSPLGSLYFTGICRSESMSDNSGGSLDDPGHSSSIEQSDSSESGYASEKEATNSDVDLTKAKFVGVCDISLTNDIDLQRNNEFMKARPSTFCKVLCTKPRAFDMPKIADLPKGLTEYLGSLDYWQHFCFDTPSPDDIIKRKQRTFLAKGR